MNRAHQGENMVSKECATIKCRQLLNIWTIRNFSGFKYTDLIIWIMNNIFRKWEKIVHKFKSQTSGRLIYGKQQAKCNNQKGFIIWIPYNFASLKGDNTLYGQRHQFQQSHINCLLYSKRESLSQNILFTAPKNNDSLRKGRCWFRFWLRSKVWMLIYYEKNVVNFIFFLSVSYIHLRPRKTSHRWVKE